MRSAVVAFALLLGGAVAPAQDAPGYRFLLDGRPFEPEIVSLEGTPGAPRPGDLACVQDNLWITLGERGEYRFRFAADDLSRLLLAGRVVAVRVFTDEDDALVNPLKTMSPKQIRTLRGLSLLQWDEDVLRRARHIDPAVAALTVMCDERDMPALPAALERLCILGNPTSSASTLAKLSSLRAFLARDYSGEFDWSPLVAPGLRVVIAPFTKAGDGAALARFPELRALELTGMRELGSVAFASKMPHLRVLSVAHTPVADLGPLAGHPALVRVVVTGAPVERLPVGRMPALRELLALGARVPDEQGEAFRKANPACRLELRWVSALREAIESCDRIRVRSGGTCHRNEDEEKTLFEVRAGAELRSSIAKIRIAEDRSGSLCMCCGEPTFEFYAGEKLLAMVGFHHAQSLRWAGGIWPGDAGLTAESAADLCEWLDRHGVPGPLANHKKNVARAKARHVRQQRSKRIIGEEAYARLKGARGREAVAAALTSVAETEQERVYLWLSLRGCHEGGWDRFSSLDSALDDLLRGASAEAIRAAVKRAVADPWARAGAARWILGEQHWSVLEDGTTLAETVSVLARSGLTHPRPYSRRRTLIALGKMGGEHATASLRAVVAGGVSPRALGPDEVAESSGMISRRGEPEEIRGVESERAIAAFFLARMGDKNSLPALRKLLDELQGENRDLVQRAISLLEGR